MQKNGNTVTPVREHRYSAVEPLYSAEEAVYFAEEPVYSAAEHQSSDGREKVTKYLEIS